MWWKLSATKGVELGVVGGGGGGGGGRKNNVHPQTWNGLLYIKQKKGNVTLVPCQFAENQNAELYIKYYVKCFGGFNVIFI